MTTVIRIYQITSYVIGISYVPFAMFTYGFILLKIQKSRRKFQSGNRGPVQQYLRVGKEHLVPFMIITTYIGFYIVPKVIEIMYLAGNDNLLMVATFFSLLPKFGMVVDPIIYLLLTKQFRNNLKRFCIQVREKITCFRK